MTARRSSLSESGVTLIELVVTVAIMGISMVFILAGMTTSIFASDVHRKQATAETVVRTFAEQVKQVSCTPNCPTTYSFTGTVPTGFNAPTAVVVCGTPGTTSFTAACPTEVQKVTLTVRSTDGRDSETLEIVKRKP